MQRQPGFPTRLLAVPLSREGRVPGHVRQAPAFQFLTLPF